MSCTQEYDVVRKMYDVRTKTFDEMHTDRPKLSFEHQQGNVGFITQMTLHLTLGIGYMWHCTKHTYKQHLSQYVFWW